MRLLNYCDIFFVRRGRRGRMFRKIRKIRKFRVIRFIWSFRVIWSFRDIRVIRSFIIKKPPGHESCPRLWAASLLLRSVGLPAWGCHPYINVACLYSYKCCLSLTAINIFCLYSYKYFLSLQQVLYLLVYISYLHVSLYRGAFSVEEEECRDALHVVHYC